MQQQASVEVSPIFVKVLTFSGSGLDFVDPAGSYILLDAEATDEEVGQAVINALAASRWIVPSVEMRELFNGGRLKAILDKREKKMTAVLGLKSRREIYRDIKGCMLQQKDGTIGFQTMISLGMGNYDFFTKGYINPIPSNASPSLIGAAARRNCIETSVKKALSD